MFCSLRINHSAHFVQAAKQQLEEKGYRDLHIPQARPLSAGETLGCTAPTLPPHIQTIVFVADGRFHLEALMIANPSLPAFRCFPTFITFLAHILHTNVYNYSSVIYANALLLVLIDCAYGAKMMLYVLAVSEDHVAGMIHTEEP